MRALGVLLLSGCVGVASPELEDQPPSAAVPMTVTAQPSRVERTEPTPGAAPVVLSPVGEVSAVRWADVVITPPPVDRGGTMNGAEFIWIDQDITWDVNNVGEAVAHNPPLDWSSPLDYFNGLIEVRLDVTAKHDATKVWLELCAWHDFLGSTNHTCVHCLDPDQLTQPGTYTCETTAGTFEPSTFWSTGFAAMEHRVKDGTNGRGNDLENEGIGLPISAHYSIVLVPKGMAFSGWANYPL
jgi:hypothetical protein